MSTLSATSPDRPQPGPSTALLRPPRGADRQTTWLGLAAGCGLLAVIFWPNLRHFAHTWATDENYSHGFLVPLLGLYFAREASRRGPIPAGGGVGLGVALLSAAILGRLATIVVPVGVVGDGSLLLGLAGLCALIVGASALRRFAFAIGFLAFMVPLPIALYATIAAPLQLLNSHVAAAVLNAIDIPVLCEGNNLTLPGDVRMFVAEACSGMRQMTGFLALTTAVAYLSARPLWQRLTLVASALPIAMTANVTRVVLTGIIMYQVDPHYASGAYHTAEGLLMLGFGLALLGAEVWVLDRLFRKSDGTTETAATRSDLARGPAPSRDRTGLSAPRRAGLAIALLTVGLGAGTALERATVTERPPLKRPLATLPMRLGDWVGRDEPIDPLVREKAQTDDCLNRVYEQAGKPGRRLVLWLNYSRLGLNLRHSPEVCLPGNGWTKVEARCRPMTIHYGDRRRLEITKLGYEQGELVQGVGFWYYIFGEGPWERHVRALPITSRSSHGRTTRGSGLTVEVFCPGESDPEGEALADFARALLPELESLLPDDRACYAVP